MPHLYQITVEIIVSFEKNEKLCVGTEGNWRFQIIENLNGGVEGGHISITATIKCISNLFWWPQLQQQVSEFVNACKICQRFKGEHVNYPWLLQPIPIPNDRWEDVTVDFIESLTKEDEKDNILIIIDKYTKYIHIFSLCSTRSLQHK